MDNKTKLEKIQNSEELLQKIQRMHEIQSQLIEMGAMDLVNELLDIKAQIALLFEKPKRVRRTKAQMQAEREKENKEGEVTRQQNKKPKGGKPKGE
ncbi:hypothetical protein [Helicobacter felis]|uniref:hypothetical protein n=1 Tax=Helicobacter felis TaxID=214 RepID=UPI000CEF0B6D|nr:hypothetical protein [Helicobacter felis]